MRPKMRPSFLGRVDGAPARAAAHCAGREPKAASLFGCGDGSQDGGELRDGRRPRGSCLGPVNLRLCALFPKFRLRPVDSGSAETVVTVTAAGQSLPVSASGPPGRLAVGKGSEGGAALDGAGFPCRPQFLPLPRLRIAQRVALFEKFLAEFACVAVAVELAQFAPLAGVAALHRPPDLVQMGVLLALRGRREHRPQMIVAGRTGELEHRARCPGMAHEFAAAPSGVVPDALRAKDLAALALVAFRPLRQFQLGIREGGGFAGRRVNAVDDDVNVGLRLVRRGRE